jgi:putative ABC transport system permease protein
MAHLHTGIGRTIRIARADGKGTTPVTVVGRAVLPGLAPYPGSDKAGLGTGAVFTVPGWRTYSQDFQKDEYVFRWADGGSTDALTRAFTREMPSQLPLGVNAVNRPAGIVSAENLRSTPTLLVSLVVVLLVVAVINALIVTIRRRRRDLALLRTLGSTSGQLVRAVLWQASTIGVVAVLLGVPVGIVLGRLGWDVLADGLGAIAVPEVPAAAIVVIGVAVLVLANVVGLVPGLRAARRSPAGLLRVE